jgi:hypothetical protein
MFSYIRFRHDTLAITALMPKKGLLLLPAGVLQVPVAPRASSDTAAAKRVMAAAATKDRAKGAVVGALVADAATMGLHCELQMLGSHQQCSSCFACIECGLGASSSAVQQQQQQQQQDEQLINILAHGSRGLVACRKRSTVT